MDDFGFLIEILGKLRLFDEINERCEISKEVYFSLFVKVFDNFPKTAS